MNWIRTDLKKGRAPGKDLYISTSSHRAYSLFRIRVLDSSTAPDFPRCPHSPYRCSTDRRERCGAKHENRPYDSDVKKNRQASQGGDEVYISGTESRLS
jgi:hypothetical protein